MNVTDNKPNQDRIPVTIETLTHRPKQTTGEMSNVERLERFWASRVRDGSGSTD